MVSLNFNFYWFYYISKQTKENVSDFDFQPTAIALRKRKTISLMKVQKRRSRQQSKTEFLFFWALLAVETSIYSQGETSRYLSMSICAALFIRLLYGKWQWQIFRCVLFAFVWIGKLNDCIWPKNKKGFRNEITGILFLNPFSY